MKAIYSKAIIAGIPLGIAIASCYISLEWYAWKCMDKFTSDTWAWSLCEYIMVVSTIIYAVGGVLAVAYARKGLQRTIDAGRVAFVAVITADILGGILIGTAAVLTPVMGEPPAGMPGMALKVAGMPVMLLVTTIPGLFFAVQAGKFFYDWQAKKRCAAVRVP